MSAIDLFNEMVILRDKIDPQMQMDIWPKLFYLLPASADTLTLSLTEFTEFLTTVAQLAANRSRNDNAALASEHLTADHSVVDRSAIVVNSSPPSRGIVNVFPNRTTSAIPDIDDGSTFNLATLRRTCRKVLQYYTLTSTTASEFKVHDIVSCLLYLFRNDNYRPLYNYLESNFGETCMPTLTPDQIYYMTNLLRSLLDLPSSSIDYENLKLLRANVGKIINYPLTRFARVIIVPDDALSNTKPQTLEDLILDRAPRIANLEPQQYVDNSDTQIPYCDDENFINKLAHMTHDFSLERMFYNAANSIFYTTMENYAITNCRFEVNNYNNIFKCMDEYKILSENCGYKQKNEDLTDSLNIYLNGYNNANNKRKKY
ncbi:C42 [Buzura suppressaria nucleopolyhedrovirus]|uniref:C42 n=1 Tax=Buzura suppressaria nuclear polyhedrosis virus TaxID=74320 RepID=W5VKJ2_NPVBS|nr:C42 [Buzura suppressaria nucleopolyhedrovirus]AHH82666.1 C42 [Buzura suppressaria nucleopolyhedrovirus]AKN91049.1 C42 [Buzura suppressaria nucleopolyhedrovirus]